MGYTTNFKGKFEFNKPLAPEHSKYLMQLTDTRRMQRDPKKAEKLIDPIRQAVGLPIGLEGEYFVGGCGFKGQDGDESVTEHNTPPRTQPGLWCQWEPSEDGKYLQWNGGEKFYEYVKWLRYIIDNFLTRWNYKITGIVDWQGEEDSDKGRIIAKDNKLEIITLS
jgi:hypothetical protein